MSASDARMETVVERAKADVHAHMTMAIQTAGLSSLRTSGAEGPKAIEGSTDV